MNCKETLVKIDSKIDIGIISIPDNMMMENNAVCMYRWYYMVLVDGTDIDIVYMYLYGIYCRVLGDGIKIVIFVVYMNSTDCTVLENGTGLRQGYGIDTYYHNILVNKHTTEKNHTIT